MNNYIKIIFITIILPSCNIFQFGKGVQEDFETAFRNKKEFFYNIGFSGIVSDKKEYSSELAQYRVIIKLQDNIGEILLKDVQNPPYYSFDSTTPKTLELTVSKIIYDNIGKEERIIKEQKSDSISVKEIKYLLLSKEDSKWVP